MARKEVTKPCRVCGGTKQKKPMLKNMIHADCAKRVPLWFLEFVEERQRNKKIK